jgi:predicted outer membrane repeat protein
VAIKGGYAGFGGADPNARDIKLYETILSGDIFGNDREVNDPRDLLNDPCRADNNYHVVTGSGTDETAILDGFTITGGNANRSREYFRADRGGGMFNDDGSPNVTNCTFRDNAAKYYGGGMCNNEGNPTLTNCTFSDNSTFGDNWESGGGAMYNHRSNPRLTNCIFSANLSKNGGGISNWQDSSPTLTNCTFNENSAKGSGGGMYNWNDSQSALTNCIFINNSAEITGGGICNRMVSDPKVTNCIFIGNSANIGGGMFIECLSGSIVTNCTFTGNSSGLGGGGIYSGLGCPPPAGSPSLPVITNCILYGNTPDELYGEDRWPPVVTYSDVQGGWPGQGNIDADPYFKDPGYWGHRDDPNTVVEPNDPNAIWIDGDYHLLGGSPCIDAGDPNYVPEPNETDLDGRPRVIGGRIDMGAYEFFNTTPVANAGDDKIVECACNTAEGTKVTLDGSGSYDVDGDALTYRWTGPFIESPVEGAAPTVTLEGGCPAEYVITLVVNDGTEDSEPNEVVITVVDTTPPEFTFSVSPTMLWPPNKKMVQITPSWTVSDDCDTTPDVLLVSVSMNESETRGKGHNGDDIQIGEDGTIYVRAKRNRTGDRIYTITYQAVDDSGNAAVRSATVTVPRKRR